MMGVTVDIQKTIGTVHDERMKNLFTAMAERLIEHNDFEVLEQLDQVVSAYEDLSRKNFGPKQTVLNRREKDRAYQCMLGR